MKTRKKFLIIDSNSVIHRAFHALPPLTNSDGTVINAAYGFFSVLIKSVREIEPDCIIATFDLPEPTFRHKEFKEYKANRPSTPDELIGQFHMIKEGLKSLGVPVVEKGGFEADDMIGTVARIVSDRKMGHSVVLSGDKDNLQLVGPNTEVLLLKKGIKDIATYNVSKFKEDYGGLEPQQLIEVKSLQGDPSDNIPGVPGIGVKTALELIAKFGNLETVYAEVDRESEAITPSVSSKLSDNREKAFVSRDLVTIRTDVDLGDLDLDVCHWKGFESTEAMKFFERMGFDTLIKRIKTINEKPEKKNLSLF